MDEIDLEPYSREFKKLKTMHDKSDKPIISEMSRPDIDSLDAVMEVATPSLTQDHEIANVSPISISKENECGITEFVTSDALGFAGILKKRYTDFLVNEILPSGVVVHLSSSTTSSNKTPLNPSNSIEIAPSSLAGDVSHISPTSTQGINTATNEDNITLQPVSNFIAEEKVSSSDEANGGVILQKPSEMEDRAIHEDQAPVHLVDSSEIENSSRPRIRHNVLLRPTDSGLVEVTNQDEAKLLLAQMEASDNHKKESTSKLDPQTANEDPSSEAGSQAHEKSSPALWRAFSEAPKLAKVSAEDEHLLISYFGDQVVQAILALYENILNSPLRKAKDYGTVTSAKITDRELRTKIHTAIRRIFNSHLETTTNEDGAVMIFAAAPKSTWTARTPTANQEQKRKPYRKGKPGWTELGGEYLHFTLYKENKDTMEVISFLARQLNLKARSFQFAGTKDRRAVTAQRVSVYRVFADRMTQVGRSLKNAKIGDFEYQPHGLQLGDLTGNEFTITLRDCEFEGIVSADSNSADAMDKASQIVRNAVANLKRKGFINYYGLQRFGTFSTRTDTVGLKILQGDFKAAVEAVLDYSPTALAASQNPMPSSDKVSKDDKARACALRSFQTSGKIHPALDQLPHKFSAETSIIQHLGKPHSSNDFQGALMAISRNLRLMYVHAYQSLVWNIAASERWKQFGDQVLEGDLVLVEDHKDKIENAIELDKIDADGELVVHSTDEDRSGQADDIFTRARALTKDEATSGHYSIFDIVLPTPGFDILYPANEIALVYTNFMASDRGGGLDPLDMRRKWKDFSLSGSYRKLLARPGQDVSYDIKMYKNDDEQFVKTDIDDLFNDQEQPQKDHFSANVVKLNENSTHNGQENEEVGKVDEATKFAVVLKLQLGTSQYATIALRELMKANGLQAYKPDFGGGR